MLELLQDPAVWAAFATLTVMEIVLGIDNIIFISVLVSRLPPEQANRARQIGIGLALVFRIALLLVIGWVISLKDPVFSLFGHGFSWKDLILIAGGLFLIYKATHEMHSAIEEPHEAKTSGATATFGAIIAQIVVIDMVFSIDSIITAVGMTEHVPVMIAAVIVAVGVMFLASGPVARFVAEHPTTKMLALAFLLLIGVVLAADGFGFHIEKGYIYSAMAFSIFVELINIVGKARRQRREGKGTASTFAPFTGHGGAIAGSAAAIAATGRGTTVVSAPAPAEKPAAPAPRSRGKSTAVSRAQSRPKSAPRKGPSK